MTPQAWIALATLLVQVVVAPIIWSAFRVVRDICTAVAQLRHDMAEQSARVVRLEEWRLGHTLRDDERHAENTTLLNELLRRTAARTGE